MIRADPFRACRVKGIGIHETLQATSILLNRLGIGFQPRMLRVDHQRRKPDTWDAACITNRLGNTRHALRELLVGTPIAIHLLIAVINLDDALAKSVGVFFNRLSHIQHVSSIDFGGAVIPTAPAVNGSFITTHTMGGSDPARPDIGRRFRGFERDDHLFTATAFTRTHEHAIHLHDCFDDFVAHFHTDMCLGRTDWPDKKACTVGTIHHRHLIEAFLHLTER